MINEHITGFTREIGKPVNWNEALHGPCGSIIVRDETHEASGRNLMMTLWRPTAEELEILNGGGLLKLGIMGEIHPVICLEIVP